MTQSSVLVLGVATAVLQHLQAVLALASAPCLGLSEQIGKRQGSLLVRLHTPLPALQPGRRGLRLWPAGAGTNTRFVQRVGEPGVRGATPAQSCPPPVQRKPLPAGRQF